MAELVREAALSNKLCSEIAVQAGPRYIDPVQLDLWVRGHFRYRGELLEVVRTPAFMWNDWQTTGTFEGDCDDVSVMFATILTCLGWKMVRFVAIRYEPDNPGFSHVFVEVYYAGAWRVFDQTVSPGTQHTILERMTMAI